MVTQKELEKLMKVSNDVKLPKIGANIASILSFMEISSKGSDWTKASLIQILENINLYAGRSYNLSVQIEKAGKIDDDVTEQLHTTMTSLTSLVFMYWDKAHTNPIGCGYTEFFNKILIGELNNVKNLEKKRIINE